MAIKCLVAGGEAVLLSDVAPCRLPILWQMATHITRGQQ